MSAAAPLRVLVTPATIPAPWQRAVVERLRETGAVIVTGSGDQRVDVVIDFGGAAPLRESRFGTWRHGFSVHAHSAPAAVGTLARLYRVTPEAGPSAGVVMIEGWFRAASDEGPGTGDVGAGVSSWCASVVRQLASGDRSALGGDAVDMHECAEVAPPLLMAPVLARARTAWRRWRRRERWTVGIVASPLEEIVSRGAMPEPRWIADVPSDRYIADPFPVASDRSRLSLLVEEYAYGAGRGRIVRMTVTPEGALVDRTDWLTADHHLAYPFVLRSGAETVCVPDAAATGSICAYTLNGSAPTPTTLITDFPGVDPTLVEHDGRWWLFCTRRGPENQTGLHAFFAPRWQGPWQPHACNPIKSDARSSRPAGSFFTLDGHLHRPAQDCSRRYGGAIAINRIESLTPTRFRERTVATLRPDGGWSWPDGMHTINAARDVVVVDGLRVER